MNTKIRHIVLSSSIALLFFLSSFTNVSAATKSWNAGNTFVWGNKYEFASAITDTEDGFTQTQDFVIISDLMYNLTAIDTIDLTYQYIYSDYDGTDGESTRSYDSEDFITQQLEIEDLFSVNYEWNYRTNTTVLVGFDFDITINSWYLIEPDWQAINEAFVEGLNGSYIIDTVDDPYEAITYNITLADCLNDIAFSIMGRNTLSKAKGRFKADTTSWTFSFDAAPSLKNPFFNGTFGHNDYTSYNVFAQSYEIEYEQGGVLKNYAHTERIKETDEAIITDERETTVIALGGYKSAAGSLNYLYIFAGIVTFGVFVIVVRKRGKKAT